MTKPLLTESTAGYAPDTHQDIFSKTTLGFWMYLMTDCILFASLFLPYAVLKNSTFGGPTSQDLFSLDIALAETLILLCSSVTCGLAILSAVQNKKKHVILWLFATLLLGGTFLTLELQEFAHLIKEGNSWQRSAFLSAFFTLVSTHGLHITFGMLWGLIMTAQVMHYGISPMTFRRLTIFSMFWHFLDLIWIFIFTYVYLAGVL